ncbi:MAG TPA: phage/plasmid primase, P4 family [Micromonospora sp.]|nr:phage/plasmid primase, P4 family [Micromonospora sp.]
MPSDNGQTGRPAEYIDGCDSTTRRELHQASAIDPAVTRERGYETITRPNNSDDQQRQRLRKIRIPGWATNEDRYYPGILIPLWSPTGAKISYQWKPRVAVPNRDGKKMKYASQQGRSSVLDVHPRWTTLHDGVVPPIRDTTQALWITEGVKKADSLTSRGAVTIALNGVYNWRSNLGTLGDWEDVPLTNRTVYVCFDADATTNPMVLRAMTRLGRWLKSKGADPRYVIPPAHLGETATKGVDDYFAAGGTIDELLERAARTPPQPPSQEDPFTDSALAELVAHDALADQYLHVTNLGWYTYDGRVWKPVADGAAVEAVREYLRDRYRAALAEAADALRRGDVVTGDDIDQWRRVQSAKVINAVLSLARNIDGVAADIRDFDSHHDLLNTPDGVLDLRTLDTIPHDPSLKFTKITAVGFDPGAESHDLKTALQAVPDDTLDWLQMRLGQAITGYEPDDDRLLLFQGGGSNGKTVLLGGVRAALGSYAASIPNTLLLTGGKEAGGRATPEKMTLQGVRMGYMEETAEGRHLDVQALKEVVGNRTITARQLYKGFVEFGTTHTLFLNTNPLPEVRDTDHGTWRRLLRVPFPYTFVGPNDPLGPGHRRGDPGIKRRMVERPTRENQAATLAWLVIGAHAWYLQDQNLSVEPIPRSVQEATAEWRAYADPIIRFMITHTVAKPTAWIETAELVRVLRGWMLDQGMQPGATNMLTNRVKSHSGLPNGAVAQQIRTANYGAPSRHGGEGSPGRVAARVQALLGVEWLPLDERS